jgi:hypothetical protein
MAENISACGQIERNHECLVFWRFDVPGSYLLPDSIVVAAPGVFHVTGESFMAPDPCEPFVPGLRDVVIGPCTPDTLGCGVLGHFASDDGDCYCWRHLPEQSVFNVLDLGGFSVGDTVIAFGIPCPACLPVGGTCASFGVPLFDAHFVACSDSLNPLVPETWGGMKWRYRR